MHHRFGTVGPVIALVVVLPRSTRLYRPLNRFRLVNYTSLHYVSVSVRLLTTTAINYKQKLLHYYC
jgi:hypothetical protein